MPSIILFLQSFSPEIILVLEYITCCVILVGMTYVFGRSGVYVYMITALIIANIQVIKLAQFCFMDAPIALGTIVFSSLYMAADLLTERFGPTSAHKAVWMGFASCLMITIFMLLTLGIAPVTHNQSILNLETCSAHQAIDILFSPAPRILMASLISYVCSQYTDIWIFQTVRRLTHERYLWLRTMVAAAISSLLDSILFSTLVWYILTTNPVPLTTLWYSYILGTYIFRLVIIVVQAPMLYILKACLNRGKPQPV